MSAECYQLLRDLCQILSANTDKVIDVPSNLSNSGICQLIKSIFIHLCESKQLLENQLNELLENDYEAMIQKLEGQVRSHIRVEQQQRLQIEFLSQSLEEQDIKFNKLQVQLNDKISSLESQLANQNQKESSPKRINYLNIESSPKLKKSLPRKRSLAFQINLAKMVYLRDTITNNKIIKTQRDDSSRLHTHKGSTTTQVTLTDMPRNNSCEENSQKQVKYKPSYKILLSRKSM